MTNRYMPTAPGHYWYRDHATSRMEIASIGQMPNGTLVAYQIGTPVHWCVDSIDWVARVVTPDEVATMRDAILAA